jgi:hypothetical protein
MWEVSFPTSPVDFSSHCHFYKLSSSKVAGRCRHSCLLQPACLFTVLWGISPPPSSELRVPHPLCYVSFFGVVVYSVCSLSLLSLGGGQSVQGAMLIWPSVVCGSTWCCLAHLVVCISWANRKWRLVAWEPSWFLHLPWSVDAMCGLGVWRSQSFASSRWFFL